MNVASSSPLDQSVEPMLPAAYSLLRRLGVTEKYMGFRYVAYASALAAADPDRLLLVTKLLYPDIAKRFETSWSAVERDMRTVINIAWKQNPTFLDYLSQAHLEHKPSCAHFLAILSYWLQFTQLSHM